METTTATASTASKTVNPYAKKMRPGVAGLLAKCDGNPLLYGALLEKSLRLFWYEDNGYKAISTFPSDFGIADLFGDDAVLDTYKSAWGSWKSNYKMATELCMTLNSLSWFYYQLDELSLSRIYSDLYYKCRDAFYDLYEDRDGDTEQEKERKGEARGWFFKNID